MSAVWSGFSEEDILKYISRSKKKTEELKTVSPTRRFVKAKRRENQGESCMNSKNVSPNSTPIFYDLPEAANLSSNKEKPVMEKIVSTPVIKEKTRNLPEAVNLSSSKEKPVTEKIVSTPIIKENTTNLKNEISEIPSPMVKHSNSHNSVNNGKLNIEKKVIDLDEFQARQKLIEEQNRKRKELLVKALADKTRETEEEAKKLNEIKNEFRKLDALLSNDVSILRIQIENASLDFMEAQKRYHRIEKEFLEAKLLLHTKLERKEMLTEHLCTIIEKNEERKAEKLSELMTRLSVDESLIENSDKTPSENNTQNRESMIDEIKNRREIKIDLQPEKSELTLTSNNGSS